jgi:hypothetical protein
MTPSEISSIETQLKLKLPEPYVHAANAGRFCDPIHDDAQSIVAINLSFRTGEYGDTNWRPSLVAFGHDGAGNCFCLDTESFDSGVYIRDHETLEVTREYDSFDAFLHEWDREALETPSQEKEEPSDATERRRWWWQFW